MRNTDKPKYKKLKDYIIETIESNQLKPGDKMHSENELSHMFEISRHTVRQALGDLVKEGWLFKIQGKGLLSAKGRTGALHPRQLQGA